MKRILLALWLTLLPVLALAQADTGPAAQDGIAADAADLSAQVEDDKGFLTRFLEQNLSGAGRQVVITGFQGALSSRATFQSITIADADGVWLELKDGAIQWNRSALLGRRIEIEELSAQTILLPRLPNSTGTGTGTTPEIRDFQLPTLPVSVDIANISAGRVELGKPVIGEAAVVSVDGAMHLEGGEGTAKLTIKRVDGTPGVFALDAGFDNASRRLKLDLTLDEGPDGLFANLVNLYDKPAVHAEIKGDGPLSDFTADIRLATNGQDRVTGKASVHAQAGDDGTPGTAFRMELSGDVASLLPPEQGAFFGQQSQLLAEGWRGESGRLSVPVLLVDTQALNLTGSVTTNDKGAPQSLVVLLSLGEDAGATDLPVRLPVPGAPITVQSGSLQISYDAAQGEAWTAKGRVGEIARDGNHIGALTLDGSGTVQLDAGALQQVVGNIRFGAERLALADKGLQAALGTEITGGAKFDLTPGNALELSDLSIEGKDYGLFGTLRADGLRSGITVSGEMDAAYEDLSRLSTLAGRPLTGQASATVSGLYTLLTGGFDVEATVTGSDITLDQPQLDRLLAGEATIDVSARRDEDGIELRDLSVDAPRLTAQAKGTLSSDASDVQAHLKLSSLTDADPDMAGSLEADATLSGPAGQRRVTLNGQAVDLAVGIPELDGALQGRTDLTVTGQQNGDAFTVDTLQLANPQLTVDGSGQFGPDMLDAKLNLDVPDLAVLGHGLSGALTATATASQKGDTRYLDLTGTGTELRLGQKDVDGALTGTTDIALTARQQGDSFTIETARIRNDQAEITAQGTYAPDGTDLTAHVDVGDLAALGLGWSGSVSADASLADDGSGGRRLTVDGTANDLSLGQASVDAALAGPTQLTLRGTERDGVLTLDDATIRNDRLNAEAQGRIGGNDTDVTATLNADSLNFLGRGIRGAVNATAQLVDKGDGVRRLTVQGTATGLQIGNPRIDPLLTGQTTFDLAATQDSDGISVQRLDLRNGQLRITADGDPATGLDVDVMLNDLGLLAPGLSGPVTASGTVRQQGDSYVVDIAATGPGGTRAQISGTVARDFSTTDLRISGVSDAAIVNPLLRVRSVEGPVSFDLRMRGKPSLDALSGTVSLPNARLSDPKLGVRIDDLTANANLQNGLINVDMSGNLMAGGGLGVTGTIDLRGGSPRFDLRADLNDAVLRDPNLYETTANGTVTITGNAAEGPLISGRIELGETEIRIPSTGLGGAKAIPDITHLGERPAVRGTLAKAGLLPFPSADARIAGLAGPPATPPKIAARLDLTISAPNQVFVRGRGVDAELGGQIRLTGNARNVIPIGQLELIRGRVELLGKRFVMTEGLIETARQPGPGPATGRGNRTGRDHDPHHHRRRGARSGHHLRIRPRHAPGRGPVAVAVRSRPGQHQRPAGGPAGQRSGCPGRHRKRGDRVASARLGRAGRSGPDDGRQRPGVRPGREIPVEEPLQRRGRGCRRKDPDQPEPGRFQRTDGACIRVKRGRQHGRPVLRTGLLISADAPRRPPAVLAPFEKTTS